jgi:uncharacterized oxidoreductase
MNLASNTILITGGASGIGLAIAERFLAAGSKVILCGRRADKLREAQKKHPEFVTHVCDVEQAAERTELFAWAVREFPKLNVLVNNAGIQRRVQLAAQEDWEQTRQEIAINLDAPIHLSRLFIPHLMKQQNPAILNVTSGLSFVPLANVPVYCATKAALHSFTLSLRHQLAGSGVQVVEIIPPAVDTDLGGPGLHKFGVNVDEFAASAFARLAAGEMEIAYGFAQQSSQASRQELEAIFTRLNQPR